VQKKLLEESEANAVMKRQITNELNQLNLREQRVKDSFLMATSREKNGRKKKSILR